MTDEKHRKLWSFIINQGENEDPAGRNREIGRCASTNYAITTEIERRNPRLAEGRAYLDVRLGQIMAFLRVRTGNNPHREGVEQLKATFVPKTGRSFLLNSEGCPRQVLHSGFDLEPAEGMSVIDPRFNPGYFMVATGPGDHAVPIWVNKLGHIALWSWKQEEERGFSRWRGNEGFLLRPFLLQTVTFHTRGPCSRNLTTRDPLDITFILCRKGTSCPMVFICWITMVQPFLIVPMRMKMIWKLKSLKKNKRETTIIVNNC